MLYRANKTASNKSTAVQNARKQRKDTYDEKYIFNFLPYKDKYLEYPRDVFEEINIGIVTRAIPIRKVFTYNITHSGSYVIGKTRGEYEKVYDLIVEAEKKRSLFCNTSGLNLSQMLALKKGVKGEQGLLDQDGCMLIVAIKDEELQGVAIVRTYKKDISKSNYIENAIDKKIAQWRKIFPGKQPKILSLELICSLKDSQSEDFNFNVTAYYSLITFLKTYCNVNNYSYVVTKVENRQSFEFLNNFNFDIIFHDKEAMLARTNDMFSRTNFPF